MISSPLVCNSDRRREVLRDLNGASPPEQNWNGIDYVEAVVVSGKAIELRVFMLCDPQGEPPTWHFKLLDDQGSVIDVHRHASQPNPVVLGVERKLAAGNYSLHLSGERVDPRFGVATFAVRTTDITLVDPKPRDACPPPPSREPEINYLARDFSSLRQLILDRLALIMPDWQERHIPDLGVTLVELLAYVGDQLSYYQDAVATEAYLGTARSRISVRRHARLVDYQLHEGCNARGFLHLQVSGDPRLRSDDVYFITRPSDVELAKKIVIAEHELAEEPPGAFQPFEAIRLPDACPMIGLTDLKNWAGFIACLVEAEKCCGQPLAVALFAKLREQLREQLRKYARHAATDPPADLIRTLRDDLNRILEQHCLWTEDDCGLLDPEGRVLQVVAELGRGVSLARCNRTCLEQAFPAYFTKTRRLDERISLYSAHNTIRFHTWDQAECCLPAGATSATLRDEFLPGEAAAIPDSPCSEFLQLHRRGRALQHLSPGDYLLLEEVRGPKTGNAADADPARRQVVRLTSVRFTFDPVPAPNHELDQRPPGASPLSSRLRPVVEVQWDAEDALQFALCISSVTSAPECRRIEDVSVARGNMLLVDHGVTVREPEFLGVVPQDATAACCAHETACATSCESGASPGRRNWRPRLDVQDLTFAQPVRACLPASKQLQQDVHAAVPVVDLVGLPAARSSFDEEQPPEDGQRMPPTLLSFADVRDPRRLLGAGLSEEAAAWLRYAVGADAATFIDRIQQSPNDLRSVYATPSPGAKGKRTRRLQAQVLAFEQAFRQAVQWQAMPHLLDSLAEDNHFVVEMDNDRRAQLRFGDDDLGRRPEPDTVFQVSYRTGNGPVGNVGAGKIAHLVFRNVPVGSVNQIRNPLATEGGRPPESLDHARLHAPHAFRQRLRAITADDYRELVMRDFQDEVQQARATLSWTGVQTSISVTVDPVAAVRDVDALLERIRNRLFQYRRMGHCVNVQRPNYVGLDIQLTICVQSGYLRAHVQRELLDAFSNRVLPDGRKGFFHPDNLTFGESIYLSRLVWTAKQVPGVENVTVDRLGRQGQGDHGELASGVLTLGRLEIPLVENDPGCPRHGRFSLNMVGDR